MVKFTSNLYWVSALPNMISSTYAFFDISYRILAGLEVYYFSESPETISKKGN